MYKKNYYTLECTVQVLCAFTSGFDLKKNNKKHCRVIERIKLFEKKIRNDEHKTLLQLQICNTFEVIVKRDDTAQTSDVLLFIS